MRWLITVAVAVAAAAGLYWATLASAGTTCEVCMEYAGRRHCAKAASETPGMAEQIATSTACAVLTSGVTATLQCQAQAPASLRCE